MLTAASGLLAAVTLCSFLGAETWIGEIVTHFRPQLAAAGILLAIACLWYRFRPGLVVVAVASLANLHPLSPYLVGGVQAAGEGSPMRVLTLNLQHEGADYEAVKALIERERPDLVALTEYTDEVATVVEGTRSLLPTVLRPATDGSLEVMLLTSWRVADYRTFRDAGAEYPVTAARLCREACVNVVAVHAARPLRARGELRARQFALAGELARKGGARTILLGDLNCTPWSPAFTRLLAEGGLRDSAVGRGLRPTWFNAFPLLGLPIDHILVGEAIWIRERRVAEDVGSDHFPVLAQLGIRADGGRSPPFMAE